MLSPRRNLFLSCVFVALLASALAVKFEDDDSGSSSAAAVPNTRFGGFDDSDSITVEAAPGPGDDPRFFGLGGGGGGLLGGLLGGKPGKPYGGYGGGYQPFIGGGYGYPGYPGYGVGPGVGYPIGGGPGIGYPPGLGGGYGQIAGGIKPGRCPGILGLGIGQPQYGGGYGHGGGLGGLLGFRSADQGGEAGAEEAVSSRRRRDENAVAAAPEGRALPDGSDGSVNNDARFLGMFGQTCFYDYHCPGQYKCCASGLLGKKATCQQPAIFG